MKAKLTHLTKFNCLILSVLCFSLLTVIILPCYYSTGGCFQPSAIHVYWASYMERLLNKDVNILIYQENEPGMPPLSSIMIGTNSSSRKGCDMSKGNWVHFSEGPYYTNETKCGMDSRENCMMLAGRSDTSYLKWRWQPDQCELPLFNADQFIELVRGKSMVFIGDSVARNQMQSLICLLTNVTRPEDKSKIKGLAQQWFFSDYNFTLAHLWTTHLIRIVNANIFSKEPSNLTLDVADELWASSIEEFDYVIISSGSWFLRPLTYYEKGKYLGCHQCVNDQATDVKLPYVYRKAYHTALRTILDSVKFKGTVYLRTITVSHDDCDWIRTPFRQEKVELDGVIKELLNIQKEVFNVAKREGEKKGLKFRLLQITEQMANRPDGHPSSGAHLPNGQRPDCLHWCLPGPIDLWNEMLLETMKIDNE